MLGIDDAGNVADVAFTGRGCAISQASASMLTDEIKGKPLAEIAKHGQARTCSTTWASRSARRA